MPLSLEGWFLLVETLFACLCFCAGNDLLIEGGDVHAETPTHPGEDMCPGGQPGWQAIDGTFLFAIHHPADVPLGIDPVQAAILPAGVFGTQLVLGFQALEMPVDIIRRSYCFCHGLILLRNGEHITAEIAENAE
jgi:hypothetical protein